MVDEKKTPDSVEDKIDDAADDSFPASDPPAIGGSTGPNDTTKTGPKHSSEPKPH